MFDFCNQFLQTRDELTSATADLLGRLADRNVWYAEVRFCPSLHTLEGLTEDQAVQAVIDGVRAKSEVIVAGVILCALRSKGAQHGVAVARLAKKHLQVHRVNITVYHGGEGGIPPLDKIPYVVKLHPPPP